MFLIAWWHWPCDSSHIRSASCLQAFLKDLQYAKQQVDSQGSGSQPEDLAKLQAYVTGQRKIMNLWNAGRVEYIPETTRALQLSNQRYPQHIIESTHAAMLARPLPLLDCCWMPEASCAT